MKNLLKYLLVVTALLGTAACYGNTQIEQDNVFKCETDDDCITGYKCASNNFCVEDRPAEVGNCKDGDGDGYGTGDATARANCPACVNKKDCREDCDDNNARRYPGGVEICDGIDNDCNNIVDDRIGEKDTCTVHESCAIPKDILKTYASDIQNLSYACSPFTDFGCQYKAMCNGKETGLTCVGGKLVCP